MLRGEVRLIYLDPTVGAEIRTTRPAVIVSEVAIGVLPAAGRRAPDRVAGPGGTAPWLVRIEPNRDNNLAKPSAADAFQIRSVSQTRFASLVGQIWPTDLEAIITAVRLVVGAS